MVASPKNAFARLEIDVAPQLRPFPKNASVVFAVDASHSVGREGIAAQFALARAYLGHVPDARFEIVVYRRRAERLFGEFRRAGAPIPAALEPGNGSALDEAVALALRALEGSPGPRRIVVLGDGEVRGTLDAGKVAAGLAIPRDTILHLALDAGPDDTPREVRDDDHALAPIAAAGRGILLRVSGTRGVEPSGLAPVVLGLVRPIRIDAFRASGPFRTDDVLAEGAGVRETVMIADAPARVTVEGKIWAERFRREIAASADFSKATAAFVFGEGCHSDLDEREMMRVAMFGQVVSPVTSYIAVEPGVRPSRIGIERVGGRGLVGTGRGGGGAAGFGRGRMEPPDIAALVETEVRACVARLRPAPGWLIAVDVETTLDEVVDVQPRRREPLAACIAEAVWAVRLPEAFRAFPRRQTTLHLR